MIVIGFVIESERVAVFKKGAKLCWEFLEHIKSCESSFAFDNVLPLPCQGKNPQ